MERTLSEDDMMFEEYRSRVPASEPEIPENAVCGVEFKNLSNVNKPFFCGRKATVKGQCGFYTCAHHRLRTHVDLQNGMHENRPDSEYLKAIRKSTSATETTVSYNDNAVKEVQEYIAKIWPDENTRIFFLNLMSARLEEKLRSQVTGSYQNDHEKEL
jgi:hypothetical protein